MNNAIDILNPIGRTFLRHGGCVFLPRPWVEVAESAILFDQPIRTGAGELYRCEYLYRLNEASVVARGSVRQPDRRMIYLPYWHKVVMI